MKRNKLLSWLASVGLLCVTMVASVSAAAPCLVYFHQPKTPANLRGRLKKQLLDAKIRKMRERYDNILESGEVNQGDS